MMYTIRPKNESIITWLLKYGIELETAPALHIDGTWVTICLHKMPYGPEARICYSRTELRDAIIACERIKTNKWFRVPMQHVRPFMKGQEIK